jgi:hypothetical protein
MANPSFTANMSAGLSPSDGPTISKSVTGAALNAKELLDDVFGAVVLDLAPYFASIADPRYVIILADGEGFFVNFDGKGDSDKVYKTVLLEVGPNTPGPAGVLKIKITMQGADQRIRVMTLGD